MPTWVHRLMGWRWRWRCWLLIARPWNDSKCCKLFFVVQLLLLFWRLSRAEAAAVMSALLPSPVAVDSSVLVADKLVASRILACGGCLVAHCQSVCNHCIDRWSAFGGATMH